MRDIAGRLLAATVLLAGLILPGPLVRAASMHLLHAETLAVVQLDGGEVSTVQAARRLLAAGRGKLEFVAYGRQFELELVTNDSLTGRLPPGPGAVVAGHVYLEGSIPGVSGSWARLAGSADGLRGVVWDGRELYVLEQASDVAGIRVGAPADADGVVFYRASDALLADAVIACGNPGSPRAATLDASMKSVVAELAALHKAGATREIDVGLVADVEFAAAEGAAVEQAMLDRLNIADGIFSSQLGLQLVAAELQVFRSEPDPFSATRDDTLLEQLVAHARSQPELDAMAASYLFTGREICAEGLFGCSVNGRSTATLCGGGAAAVGEPLGSVYVDALLLAHELGHNLGAVHDGLAPCEGTRRTGFLMSQYTDKLTETISACSLAQMSATLTTAGCVRAIAAPQPPESPPPSPPPPGPETGSGGGGGHSGVSVLLLAGLGWLARRLRAAALRQARG